MSVRIHSLSVNTMTAVIKHIFTPFFHRTSTNDQTQACRVCEMNGERMSAAAPSGQKV